VLQLMWKHQLIRREVDAAVAAPLTYL